METTQNREHHSASHSQSHAAVAVAGTYQIFEKRTGGELAKLPLMVTVAQTPDLIHLVVNDETNSSSMELAYPLKNVATWDPMLLASKHTRATTDGFIVEIHRGFKDEANAVLTTRIVWMKDAEGRIHESYDHFNQNGDLVTTTTSVNRLLVPVTAN